MNLSSNSTLIVCPSARLARSLQQAHAQTRLSQQLEHWQTLNVKTLETWLDEVLTNALLCGEIDVTQAPQKRLSALEERLLWEEIITQHLKQHAFGDLFDLTGLAEACIEANRYMLAWHLRISSDSAIAEETRQFLLWQQLFQTRCEHLKALEQVRYFDWQINCIAKGAGELDSNITFAGFDQSAPQEQRLRETLKQRGCEVNDLAIGLDTEAISQHLKLEDAHQEIRSMVAWAKAELSANPAAQLAMIVPNLSELRNRLADMLDDNFQPSAASPSMAESNRVYNFSLGLALSQQAVIRCALDLIQLFTSHQLAQADISQALCSPYWSASLTEADNRALLDAVMRETLAQSTTWPRLMRLIEACDKNLVHLATDTQAGLQLIKTQARKQAPSAWAHAFSALLQVLKWPGQRAESSHEYQARQAWEKALKQLEALDFLGTTISASKASQLIQHICKEQVFQPETIDIPAIQIMGMMEALSSPVDAIWVMGMNDDIWPPPARPNPLLPAHIQRAARVANADSAVQTEFALSIHKRLLHSATHVIFSSSLKQGDKHLRASPLMQCISLGELALSPANTLAESIAKNGNATLIQITDDLAPAVQEGERVRGGTGLIRAQAICPAWAFYQFRLGAKKLKTPKNGLDVAERGQLVHGALEKFWRPHDNYRHFADLQSMGEDALQQAISLACQAAIEEFTHDQDETFSPLILKLEHERLCHLLATWLSFELERQVAFKMLTCEFEKQVDISGIKVTLKIDRVHALDAGGLELVDYKTGQLPKIKSWGENRITEPQLPIYAVFFPEAHQHIAGIQFGLIKIADHRFSGVSEQDFEVEPEKRKPEFIREFSDWESLKAHWKSAIENIVQEIRSGYAANIFNDENDLAYCEVTALLRIPERQLQFERQLQSDVAKEAQDA